MTFKEGIVASMKKRFRAVIEGSSGLPFEKTGVSMPGDHVWEGYADQIIRDIVEAGRDAIIS